MPTSPAVSARKLGPDRVPPSLHRRPAQAVVGSMDASATRYAARVSMQTGRQEIIVDLKSMVGGWGPGVLAGWGG